MKSMCYNGYMAKLHDDIRAEIKRSDKDQRTIAKEANINEGQFSSFMSEARGIGIDALERLVDSMGLEIIVRPKKSKKR